VSGDPLAGARSLHTRTFDLDVRAALDAPELWQARGELLDLRKGGVIPIAADLQTAGLLHQMRVSARFDPRSRVLLAFEAEQPTVAFEASALSEGECCRDPVGRLGALAGGVLEASIELNAQSDWEADLLDAIGGPRGCSHVLALARLVGWTLCWLADDADATRESWRPGERVFQRALSYDGSQHGDEELRVELQLTDVCCAPAPPITRPLLRLARQCEVRGHALVGRSDLVLRDLRMAQRERGPTAREVDGWTDITPPGLVGHEVVRGMRRRVLESFSSKAPGAPPEAALLDLTPAVFQFCASDIDRWPTGSVDDASVVVSAGPPDSCFIWRSDGALTRAREREHEKDRRG
jgi:hypothetical protein